MDWIGTKKTETTVDVHIKAVNSETCRQLNTFNIRFKRETCDKICPNSRRLILGITKSHGKETRLYFKEMRNNEGYKYCVRGDDEFGTATLHCKDEKLINWATSEKSEAQYDCDLNFDETLNLYYIDINESKFRKGE